jgi:hypothetical protein
VYGETGTHDNTHKSKMTGKDKHMPLYSSSDIEKYLSGELSDPEMHALERAALDDPFLADALEGMAIHRSLPQHPPFQKDMEGLQKRLEQRLSDNKPIRRLMPLLVRYAAALILLLGLGITAYYTLFNRHMKTVPLAEHEVVAPAQETKTPAQTPPPAPSTTAAPSESVPATADSSKIALADRTTAAKHEAAPSFKKSEDKNLPISRALPPATYYSSPLASNSQDFRSTYKNNYLTPSKQPAAQSAIADTLILHRDSLPNGYNYIATGPSSQLVFTGKVVNLQNIPLPGATLSLKSNGLFSTVTDMNGNFRLTLPKKDSTPGVVVNYIGYEQGFMTLNTDDKTGNIILLKPQSQSLDEVMVVGYGSRKRELTKSNINAIPKPLSQVAVPADGWPAYKDYLELNKRSATIDSTIRGYESISFIVNKNGELSSFKVEQSLSPAHDSLTIRLVKQGPSWKTLNGKKERARVILTW